MPPPVPQQGSRAGLITAVIIFVILWLVSTVLFFQERGKRQAAENEKEATENQFTLKHFIPADTTQGPLKTAQILVSGDQAGADAAPAAGPTAGPAILDKNIADTLAPDAKDAFTWAITERDELMKMIYPGAPTGKDAQKYIVSKQRETAETLKAVTNKPEGVNFNMNLGEICVKLADAYKKLDQAKETETAAVAAEKAKYTTLEQARAELEKTHKAALDALQAQLADRENKLKEYQAAQQVALTQVTQSNTANLEQLQQQIAALTPQIPPLQLQIADLKKRIAYLEGILRRYRMDPTDNMVRRADGAVTQVTDDGRTCYINLGLGNHITAGMTFEVYPKETGVPSLKADIPGMEDENVKRLKAANEKLRAAAEKGTGGLAGVMVAGKVEKYETQLPEGGKGSIEVISLDKGSALCRIVKLVDPNQPIRQGDVIANLVYDPNVKFKFGVFGQFDLDYNGIATLTDTNTIKRLIDQWGGKSQTVNTVEDVTPDLDFLVVGIRPVIPPLPDNPNAADMDFQNKKKADLAVYDAALTGAREWSIPVLNQTRFLYYTGYFDQRLR